MHRTILSAAIGCLIALTARAQDALDQGWSYEMIPYVWAAGLDGRVGIKSAGSSIGGSFQNLAGSLNVGTSLRVSARRPPVAWFIEANYLGYRNDAAPALDAAHVESTQTFGDVGFSYELNSSFTLYGGVRAQLLDASLDLPDRHIDGQQAWLDGIAGVRWTPFQSSRWAPWIRCDAGVGDSRHVWLAEAGIGYRWTDLWGAYLAYRALDTDYRHDDFIYNMRQSGLLFGFGVKF